MKLAVTLLEDTVSMCVEEEEGVWEEMCECVWRMRVHSVCVTVRVCGVRMQVGGCV